MGKELKILWLGPCFNPTGISTAAREMVKALTKQGVKVQVNDPWHDTWEFNKGLEFLNNPMNVKDVDATIFFDYPQYWREGRGKIIGHFIHEGTMLWPGWAEALNKADKLFVASQSNKNMFKWNGVLKENRIINYGVNPEIYKPIEKKPEGAFVFLSVNSWTGEIGDRKGTDLLIKAFNEEFKEEENVKLLLKISTFWRPPTNDHYLSNVMKITENTNKNIMVNDQYLPEEELVKHYQNSDCFVMPTRGEGFGLTAINSLACGLPLIITKDNNSGHMDFCKDRESVLWVDAPKVSQGDLRFYVKGNLLAEPDLDDLKKQMRYAFEHRKEMNEKALKDSKFIRENFSWENTAKKIIEYVKE